jgi:hypothetical protein
MCLGKQAILTQLAKYEAARRSDATEVRARLERIEVLLARLERAVHIDVALDAASLTAQEKLMTIGQELLDEVEGISDATEAVETAIEGLLVEIENGSDDPAVVQAVGELRELKSRLVAAALKGTPADPEGPVEPGDGETPVEPEPIG